jgi:MFS family permease
MANQLGLLIGPLLGGLLANVLSIPVVFLINGTLLLGIPCFVKISEGASRRVSDQRTHQLPE